MAEPLLLRVAAEVRAALAGRGLLSDVELQLWAAWDAWHTGQVPTGYATPHAYAARRVLDWLASRCATETQPGADRSPALALITAERIRQIDVKGYGPTHDDDQHPDGDLARMAAWFADPEASVIEWPGELETLPARANPVQDLVRAGALIAAEIDRLIRAGWRP